MTRFLLQNSNHRCGGIGKQILGYQNVLGIQQFLVHFNRHLYAENSFEGGNYISWNELYTILPT